MEDTNPCLGMSTFDRVEIFCSCVQHDYNILHRNLWNTLSFAYLKGPYKWTSNDGDGTGYYNLLSK